MSKNENSNFWVIVLGASSGFGEAAAIKLAEDGFNIIGIHLDRTATLPHVEEVRAEIQKQGVKEIFYNCNAADDKKMNEILDELKSNFKEDEKVKVLIHSLAFGSLKPFVHPDPNFQVLTKAQLEMTIDVMANSLVYWTQGLVIRNLLAQKSRIFVMTSSGGHSAIPNYGAVSAAKAAIESHIRQLSNELGFLQVGCSSIMAGVTDTAALRKIPGNKEMIEVARRKNPHGRLTTPEDVAKVISLLCKEGGEWVSGGIVHADGGEDIVSFVGQGKPSDDTVNF